MNATCSACSCKEMRFDIFSISTTISIFVVHDGQTRTRSYKHRISLLARQKRLRWNMMLLVQSTRRCLPRRDPFRSFSDCIPKYLESPQASLLRSSRPTRKERAQRSVDRRFTTTVARILWWLAYAGNARQTTFGKAFPTHAR